MDENNSKLAGILELSTDQLRGRQSVRATFRLPDQMIDLLRVAATHLEVKQKSLIDEIVQNKETLERVALDSLATDQPEADRRQKTFVISRNSLELLDEISSKHELSRDYLVELCIGRLIPFVDAEQEKHKQRRRLAKDIDQYMREGKTLLKKAERMLGEGDRFRTELERIIIGAEEDIKELKKYVKDKSTLMY